LSAAVVINKRPGTTILFTVLILIPVLSSYSQSPDYSKIFGNDWQKALDFVEENNHWMKPALIRQNVPWSTAVAVVFPELVRYSALRDKMEITLLKTLYRNLGNDYADFSVGPFQIKPSFAERMIEECRGTRTGRLFRSRDQFRNDYQFRAYIISELEDPVKEFNFVIAFLKICEKRFRLKNEEDSLRIKFLAAAYNTGFWKSEDEIRIMSEKKFFNTKLIKTENYPYADVSLFWYNLYHQPVTK